MRHRSRLQQWTRRHRGRLIAVAALLGLPALLVLTPGTSGAEDLTAARHGTFIKVTNDGPAKFWSGTVFRDKASHIPGVPECQTVHCEVVDLIVDLPRSVWSKAGGIEVSIRYPTEGFDDTVGLYVYRDGIRVTKSDALVATAQSVQIRFGKKDPSGHYKVYVANNSPDSPLTTPQINYEGLSEVEYDPVPAPGQAEFLPDLQLHPSPTVTFDTPNFGIFETPPPPGENCFASEKAEDGAVECLRYDIESTNTGQGNMEVRFTPPANPVDGQRVPVYQRIYKTDGTYYDQLTGGFMVWHAIHGHWHFGDYAQSSLVRVDANNVPIAGEPELPGTKPSFCIADTRLDAWGIKGNGPTTYPAPDCLGTDHQGLTHGGFGDTYNWFLNGQYINVPKTATDGRYLLRIVVDPNNRVKESNETNNCVTVVVELAGLATDTPTASNLGAGPACSSPSG